METKRTFTQEEVNNAHKYIQEASVDLLNKLYGTHFKIVKKEKEKDKDE